MSPFEDYKVMAILSQILQGRILIIDDNPANVLLLERMLKEGGFSRVHSLTDSEQALVLVKEIQPDLVLLDLHMPGMDGYEVIQQLRQEGQRQDDHEGYLPILVLTADITPGAKNKALAMGAKDFLAKPFDVVEVLLRVRNLLETRILYQKLSDSLHDCLTGNE